MPYKMKWNKLLSKKQLGSSSKDQSHWSFQLDYSRIAFSSAFRRLQDKTQVFPLAESDYARTRLTHSLEASCVGRVLGFMVGNKIIQTEKLKFRPSDFGDIVAAACLAHDIGNPPFGHSGENAFRQWFKFSSTGKEVIKKIPEEYRNDFLNFEGNAQGFRILTRLQYPTRKGGLQLTCATLATYSKYPTNSTQADDQEIHDGKSNKKPGYFMDDKSNFSEVMKATDIPKRGNHDLWIRHPLAFLVEAADNICYHISDLEDGFLLNKVPFEETKKLLLAIAKKDPTYDARDFKLLGRRASNEKDGQQSQIEYLRGKAIKSLVLEIVKCFWINKNKILSGDFDKELTGNIPSKTKLKKIKNVCLGKTYNAKEVLEIEVPGFGVIGGLLEPFTAALIDLTNNSTNQYKNEKIRTYMEGNLGFTSDLKDKDNYQKLLAITDFISGMTDSYAVSIYKKITGLSLPHF